VVAALLAGPDPCLAAVNYADTYRDGDPTVSPTPTPPPTRTADVRFEFAVSGVTGSGLTRTITAQLTNSGTADAHNVWVKAEAFYARGTRQAEWPGLLARRRRDRQVGRNRDTRNHGEYWRPGRAQGHAERATFTLTVYSDEATQALNYEYRP